MNFAAFKYFNEVTKTKAIRRAADRLHIAPSAVSRQLALLEHALGAPLVERTNSGIELTPAGVVLERYTSKMFRELDQVKESIAAFKSLNQGTVKISAMEGVLSNFLPRALSSFMDRHPGIRFDVTSLSGDLIVESLIKNEVDVAIAYNSPLRPEIEIVAERADPVMALVGASDPLADMASVTIESLCERRLAMPHQSYGLRQLFDSTVEARKLSPVNVLDCNSLELTFALSANGAAITIGPVLAAQRYIAEGTLVAIPIEVPTFLMVKSSICVHKARTLPFASSEFLKHIKAIFEDHQNEV